MHDPHPAPIDRDQQSGTPDPERAILLLGRHEGVAATLASELPFHGYRVEQREGPETAPSALDGFGTLIVDGRIGSGVALPLIRTVAALPARPGLIVLDLSLDLTDRILALEMGADDIVAWPCAPRELIARIRAIARRRVGEEEAPADGDEGEPELFVFAGWTLHRNQRRLTHWDGRSENLSAAEFAVIDALATRPRRIVSREDLLRQTAPGDGDPRHMRAIDIQVSRLRKRIEADGEEIIRTVRGRGYMLLPAVTPR